MAQHCPIGFRPSDAELIALRRAQYDLGVNRTQLLRAAVAEWLENQQKRGCISKGTSFAWSKGGTDAA
jgi:hypothetical protein